MNIDHRNPRLRRGFAFVALAAVLGLSAVGLTQCRLVDDTVTGVDVKSNSAFSGSKKSQRNGRSACEKACKEEAKQCKKDEKAKHKINKRACKDLPNSADRKACKKAESERHKAAKKECSRAKKACKEACKYQEGAGSVGR